MVVNQVKAIPSLLKANSLQAFKFFGTIHYTCSQVHRESWPYMNPDLKVPGRS